MDLANYLATHQQRIEEYLQKVLPSVDSQPSQLNQAIHYAVFNGGKRLRPLLTYATGDAFGVPLTNLDRAACAVELIHCYSLVHDDLPAMDNSDLRRGKPSCHKAFDEATAILVGDALLTEAFAVLTQQPESSPANNIVSMINELANASGALGMVAGQSLDLANTQTALSITELKEIYSKKTGALLSASILLGALCSETMTQQQLDLLRQLGYSLGLAFQIIDDILEVTVDSSVLGKPQDIDAKNNKTTFPSLLGIEQAKIEANNEINHAHQLIDELGLSHSGLSHLSNYIFTRNF